MVKYPENTVAVINNGNTAIVVDDGCYVIYNQSSDVSSSKGWGPSAWIFPEALEALKKLPPIPQEALKMSEEDRRKSEVRAAIFWHNIRAGGPFPGGR